MRPAKYVFRDFCLKQGIEFITFCLKQDNCLKQGIKKSEFCLKQGREISDICLKQGQGMRGHAAPPHPGIYRVSPRGFTNSVNVDFVSFSQLYLKQVYGESAVW